MHNGLNNNEKPLIHFMVDTAAAERVELYKIHFQKMSPTKAIESVFTLFVMS